MPISVPLVFIRLRQNTLVLVGAKRKSRSDTPAAMAGLREASLRETIIHCRITHQATDGTHDIRFMLGSE
jgi:hypothetical protein